MILQTNIGTTVVSLVRCFLEKGIVESIVLPQYFCVVLLQKRNVKYHSSYSKANSKNIFISMAQKNGHTSILYELQYIPFFEICAYITATNIVVYINHVNLSFVFFAVTSKIMTRIWPFRG